MQSFLQHYTHPDRKETKYRTILKGFGMYVFGLIVALVISLTGLIDILIGTAM